MIDSKSFFSTLRSNLDSSQDKLSLFFRSQDYYLYNLLNKKGRKKNAYPYPYPQKVNLSPNNDLPSLNVKKIIRVKGQNGTYAFKKIDYKYINKNKEALKEPEKDNNDSYSIIYNKRKALIRNNSCHLFTKDKNENNNKDIINNLLIITHINKLKVKKRNNNSIRFKRNFSCKSIERKEAKKNNSFKHNNSSITVYKKNMGTQMNENNIFLGGGKNMNSQNCRYIRPNSIILKWKI